MNNQEDYYVGLDCGTSSVGWAATDKDYHLLRLKGKTAWGSRLFDEADTAADRRIYRSARRRNRRAKARLKLLEQLFSEEIAKIDPDFYIRLRESFFIEEDKEGLSRSSKNALFNDLDYSDKDFHKEYPTIWHLRKAIMEKDEHFDIRLYFLAIHHILKHRGHFLIEGKLKGSGDFDSIFQRLVENASSHGIYINEDMSTHVEQILKKKDSITNKRKNLRDSIFLEIEDVNSRANNALAGLLAGSKITLRELFEEKPEKDAMKYSFNDGAYEDKLVDIEAEVGTDNMGLIDSAKRVYDYIILSNLLGEHQDISSAMVANYNQHQKDLAELKNLLKPFSDEYNQIFKTTVSDGKTPSYSAYIGKAYTEDKNGRRKSFVVSQEELNKHLLKVLTSHKIGSAKLLARLEESAVLPKQKGQAKGTIPQQLHHNELNIILSKLERDYPSFAKVVPNEDSKYNTKSKKIAKIHSFRIPYYCGPLVKRKYDTSGKLIPGGKSEFSWADEEISELIYPWNFDELVNKSSRADNFIRRMTNECTYLIGENVLPKSSMLYQKYMVLNELNNLKINGRRFEDVKTKRRIYEDCFKKGEISGNITLKSLKKWLVTNGYMNVKDELSGTSETKYLPKLGTYRDFQKILGVDFEKKYRAQDLETIIELITILGDEKSMLKTKILETISCSSDQAVRLSKLSYKDWGRLSTRFLTGIFANVKGREENLVSALYDTNYNLMELLSHNFGFLKKIDEYNLPKRPQVGNVTYGDVKKLYCSPAVKRTIWQAIKIINELVKIKGHVPQKIFIESTRNTDKNANGKYTMSRHGQILESYKAIKNDEDVKALIKDLESKEPRDLQNKKLFLYFTQMGKCAYSGERINIDELMTKSYDIDHIYPRSKTKDDSITNNLVLVKAEYNREKTNSYPISEVWRHKMAMTWSYWKDKGLITKEKYNRLIRSTPLTAGELGNFIARQLVETSQSAKAIRELLKFAFPKSKIILVKASQVSSFRNYFANGYRDRETGEYVFNPMREFLKVRVINDLHHAKDAYLNIVVGNAMNETFTDNPIKWIEQHQDESWSINERVLWRSNRAGHLKMKGWNYEDSIKTISYTLKRNDILWTRMNYIESGQISDLQIVGKSDKIDGILPIKKMQAGKYDPKKYGGYRSLAGAHFALIECRNKKDELQRLLVSIPIIYKNNIASYISSNYQDGRVIIPVIPTKAKLKLNGFPLHISGKTGDRIVFYPAVQPLFSPEVAVYIKRITRVVEKDRQYHGQYRIDEEHDSVSAEYNMNLFDEFCKKLEAYRKMPRLDQKIDEIITCKENFGALSIKDQCLALANFINVFTCNAVAADLSAFVPKSSRVGMGVCSGVISNYDSAFLISQSPTGLYERVINLKTVEPKS